MTTKQAIVQIIVGLFVFCGGLFVTPYVAMELLPDGWVNQWYGPGMALVLLLGTITSFFVGAAMAIDAGGAFVFGEIKKN